MAAVSTIVAVVAVAVSAVSAVQANQERKDAAGARGRAEAQNKAQKAQEAANEKRKLVREERVRRARIEQASENTGTSGSSGEIGALGGMSTQLGSNLGFNAGTLMRGRIAGQEMQTAFDSEQSAQKFDNIGSFSSSIFSAAGGFGALKGTPAGTTAQPANTGFGTGSNYGNQDYGVNF
jgi:hypothetical protein